LDGAEHLRIRRQFIEQRYRLISYLYALADENARTGAPLMRPLFWDQYASIIAILYGCDSLS